MGSLYPEEIIKIVACASSSYITKEEKTALNAIRNIKTWTPTSMAELQAVYGHDLQRLWSQFMDLYFAYDDIFTSELPKIKCPVFVLHGECDSIVFVEHAHYFKSNLPNAQLYIHKKGSHYFHVKFHAVFNNMVQRFLLETDYIVTDTCNGNEVSVASTKSS